METIKIPFTLRLNNFIWQSSIDYKPEPFETPLSIERTLSHLILNHITRQAEITIEPEVIKTALEACHIVSTKLEYEELQAEADKRAEYFENTPFNDTDDELDTWSIRDEHGPIADYNEDHDTEKLMKSVLLDKYETSV